MARRAGPARKGSVAAPPRRRGVCAGRRRCSRYAVFRGERPRGARDDRVRRLGPRLAHEADRPRGRWARGDMIHARAVLYARLRRLGVTVKTRIRRHMGFRRCERRHAPGQGGGVRHGMPDKKTDGGSGPFRAGACFGKGFHGGVARRFISSRSRVGRKTRGVAERSHGNRPRHIF